MYSSLDNNTACVSTLKLLLVEQLREIRKGIRNIVIISCPKEDAKYGQHFSKILGNLKENIIHNDV